LYPPASVKASKLKSEPTLLPLSAVAVQVAVHLVLPEVLQNKSLVVPAAALIWKLLEVITGTEKVADPDESVNLVARVVVPVVVVSKTKPVPLAVEVNASVAKTYKFASSEAMCPTDVPHCPAQETVPILSLFAIAVGTA
jgi:hypothetical protein